MMGRFLLYFAYIGSRFRGMQRQLPPQEADMPSVQGTLETAIRKLYPKNDPLITTSSRTDKGVHALMNTAHVDLEHPKEGQEYNAEYIKDVLNRSLNKDGRELLVTKVLKVKPNFHCRYAVIYRSYVYRLALVDWTDDDVKARIPIAEFERCYLIRPPFCEETLKEAARMLCGIHDFASFSSKTSPAPSSTTRNMEISVAPGNGFMPNVDASYSGTMFYDLHFKSRSFLYMQVRKLTAAMVGAAQGQIGLNDILYLLDEASIDRWPLLKIAPARGLYLRRIEYRESDLLSPPIEMTNSLK